MSVSGIENILGLTYQYMNQTQKNNISNYSLMNSLYGTGYTGLNGLYGTEYTNLLSTSTIGNQTTFADILEKIYKKSNCVNSGEVVILMPENLQKKVETDPEYAKKISSDIDNALLSKKYRNENKENLKEFSAETTKKVKYQGIRTNIISGGIEQVDLKKISPYAMVYQKRGK